MMRSRIQKLFGQSGEEPPQTISNVKNVIYYPNEQKVMVHVTPGKEPYEIVGITTLNFVDCGKVVVTTDDPDGEMSASVYLSSGKGLFKQFGNGVAGIKNLER